MHYIFEDRIILNIYFYRNPIYFVEPNTQWFYTNERFVWIVINQNIFIWVFYMIFLRIIFFFNFNDFCVIVSYLTKFLVSAVWIALTFLSNSSYSVFLAISFLLRYNNLSKSDFKPAKWVFFNQNPMYQHFLHFLNLSLLHN